MIYFVIGRFSDYSKIYSADSYNSVISSVLHDEMIYVRSVELIVCVSYKVLA